MFSKTIFKTTLLLAVFACLAFSLAAQNCDEHEHLLELIDEAFSEKNVDMLERIYHADAVVHNPNGKTEGLKAIKEARAKFHQDIPDAKGVNHDIICTDDRIIVRWTGTGTPAGAPTAISVTGITISKVVDNLIVEEWEEMNMLNLMMQMGFQLTPPAPPVEDK